MRKLVSVQEIESVHDIPDADMVERVRVQGWDVVCCKAEGHSPGDKVAFFEIDSAVPVDRGPFEFLNERMGQKTINDRPCVVIKTAKIRGVYSQGVVLPLEAISVGPETVEVGDDLTEYAEMFYSITKYEKPIPGEGAQQQKGNFPTHLVSKTDAERVQNLGPVWGEILAKFWMPTEKIDGTSATFLKHDGELIVCSRNWMLHDGDNIYWNIARELGFDELPEGRFVQGEIYGEGIQSNRLGVTGVHFAAFGAGKVGRNDYVWEASRDDDAVERLIRDHTVPVFSGLEFPSTIDEAVQQADGIKSVIAPNRLAEGIVWAHPGEEVPGLKRNLFKVISNKYLLKEKD